jgi:hypothetical protein|uniref:Uncharacterized protein n=1 Tax=viral metagenome TaxID=1070528 RepID=A0A6C0IXG3_9ZZZZ
MPSVKVVLGVLIVLSLIFQSIELILHSQNIHKNDSDAFAGVSSFTSVLSMITIITMTTTYIYNENKWKKDVEQLKSQIRKNE